MGISMGHAKHIKNDQPRQRRRARALERFSIKPGRESDAAYMERKTTELEALKARVRSAHAATQEFPA